MGARRGVRGALAPLEFEKMTSYAAVLQNTLKYPSALAIDTLYFNLKRRKNASILHGAPKHGRFIVRPGENVLAL